MSSIHNKSNVEGKENIRFEICIINFIPENINLGILKMHGLELYRRVNFDLNGGERGIRTLGPPAGGQRFSRLPRSTAPATLRFASKLQKFLFII